jgi:hypothetical protein
VDFDPGDRTARVGERTRSERNAELEHSVCEAMSEQRVNAGVGEEHLEAAESARRRVALARGAEVVAQLARDAGDRAKAEHR